ncbi:hypothetical protein CAPTEDRAFT_188939 [Capitella teleta]|uniref:G-protein coupled receptors family 1 profile domain-containing protein n=1 Tax=Capitella teleta TaxID=283909 RepID=R7UAL1_CAPTE|nr:hypothetical protein CAPTEDRAFT_188939 [Capitella teleta]|eukprot:ELU03390.1 hypothetical protein CAPTEDRAFT_188939 [Capitella teleta]
MAIVSTEGYFTEPAAELQQELDLSQFDSCILYYFIFGSCIGGLLIVIGLAGNGITIAIMGRERKKSATINCLFMLAIADSFVLLAYGFMLLPSGIRKLAFGWWNGHNYNFVTLTYVVEVTRIFAQVSAFITMLVTFQRYVSVCLPHRAKQLCSVHLVNILTCISYVASILFFLPNFFTYVLVMDSKTHRYRSVSQPLVLSSTFQILYATVATGLVTYVIPVLSLSFMSIRIIQAMKAQSKAMQKSEDRSQTRKDLTLSSLAIVAVFTLCQSFVFARSILKWVYDPYAKYARCGGVLQYFTFVPYITMVINSAANFAIYMILAKGFRKKVVRIFTGRNQIAPKGLSGETGDMSTRSRLPATNSVSMVASTSLYRSQLRPKRIIVDNMPSVA